MRNLVAHGMIAHKILTDPATMEIARKNLKNWAEQGELTQALREWQKLLDTGNQPAILAALLSIDEEGARMRSSSPFAGILSEEERALVFETPRR